MSVMPGLVKCVGGCGIPAPWGSFVCDKHWNKLSVDLRMEIIREKSRIKELRLTKPSKIFVELVNRAARELREDP